MSRPPSRRAPPITHHSSPVTFAWPVRVYHEDADSAGVVYYANYLRFMERARTEWLRARGFEQPDLAREYGIAFVVTALTVEYQRPARFNDSLTVTVEPAELGASRIRMCNGSREAALWAEAHQDPDRWPSTGIPEVVIEALAAADDD